MPLDLHVRTHIHTDGPIPGPHSLLTLASRAYTPGGRPISTFTANLRELPGATSHPAALHEWRLRPEEWLTTRRASKPPAVTIAAYTRWVDDLPGPATLVTDPYDHLFLYWYLQRFGGRWPYAQTITEPGHGNAVTRLDRSGTCALSGCRAQLFQAA